jgi:hypothetical protein
VTRHFIGGTPFFHSFFNSHRRVYPTTILANGEAVVGFFAKAEGLKIIRRQPGEGPFSWMRWPAIAILGALASLLSALLKSGLAGLMEYLTRLAKHIVAKSNGKMGKG